MQSIIANRTNGKCALSDRCLKMMTQPEAKYYVATHQVLFSIQAQLVSVISKKLRNTLGEFLRHLNSAQKGQLIPMFYTDTGLVNWVGEGEILIGWCLNLFPCRFPVNQA